MTSTVSADTRILERLSALPADQHAEFRSALTVAAVAYRRSAPVLAQAWCAFADCGRTDGAIGKALERMTVDDLQHVHAVLVGAELGSRRNTRLRDAWACCRDVVADELARRKAATPAEPATPVAKPSIPASPTRTAAVIDALRRSPDGLRTQDLTARLGGGATRQALLRLRRAGVVQLRDGINHLNTPTHEATTERASA